MILCFWKIFFFKKSSPDNKLKFFESYYSVSNPNPFKSWKEFEIRTVKGWNGVSAPDSELLFFFVKA